MGLGNLLGGLKELADNPLVTLATGGMVNPLTVTAGQAALGVLSGGSPTGVLKSSAEDYIGSRVPFLEKGFFG